MAHPRGVVALLAAANAHVSAAALIGTILLGGGAAAVALAKGAVPRPGHAAGTHATATPGPRALVASGFALGRASQPIE
jgi:hypothetical protein